MINNSESSEQPKQQIHGNQKVYSEIQLCIGYENSRNCLVKIILRQEVIAGGVWNNDQLNLITVFVTPW